MNARSMFERWKRGFLIYFWVYLAWALGSIVVIVPLLFLMFLKSPLGMNLGSLKLVIMLLPVLTAPFVVTSDTFQSAVRDLVEEREEEVSGS